MLIIIMYLDPLSCSPRGLQLIDGPGCAAGPRLPEPDCAKACVTASATATEIARNWGGETSC